MSTFADPVTGLPPSPRPAAVAFGQTLLPRALREATWRVRLHAGKGARHALALGLCAASLLTLAGTAAATAILWWPHMHG